MIREVSATCIGQNLDELLAEVQFQHGKVLITEEGKPVAALVNIALFERLRKLDEEFDRMRVEPAHAFADITGEQVDAVVDEAVKNQRSGG